MKSAPNISIPPARVTGDWSHLHEAAQVPRYWAIAEMVECYGKRFGLGASVGVLDVGCGTGELSAYIGKTHQYNGVEMSVDAISRAVPTAQRKIESGTAEGFQNYGRLYGAIVLSEVLYYCADPLAVLDKYAACLETHGIMIVTIWQRPMGLVESLKHFFVPNTNKNAWATALVHRWMQANGGALREFDVEREGGTHWRVWCSFCAPQKEGEK